MDKKTLIALMTEEEIEAARGNVAASLEERVAMGVRVLDRVVPGWDRLIGLGILNLADCYVCVLGQVWGDRDDNGYIIRAYRRSGYASALLGVAWGEWEAVAQVAQGLGFNVSPYDRSYAMLTNWWVRVISARRGASGGDAPGAE